MRRIEVAPERRRTGNADPERSARAFQPICGDRGIEGSAKRQRRRGIDRLTKLSLVSHYEMEMELGWIGTVVGKSHQTWVRTPLGCSL